MSTTSTHLLRRLGPSHLYSSHLPTPSSIIHCGVDPRLCVRLTDLSHPANHNSTNYRLFSSYNRLMIDNYGKTSDQQLMKIRKLLTGQKRKMSRKISSLCNQNQHRMYSTEEDVGVKEGCLEGVRDRFNGVWVDLRRGTIGNHQIVTAELFHKLLSNSLDVWRSDNVSSVWIKVPISMSHVINVASQHRFEFHHAEGKTAVLCLWLDDTTESKIPRFATHQIGVSGVVIDEKTRHVLVVKDKNKKYNVWKFPGGLSDLGEDIAVTAVREVMEETGVQTEFKSILAFRQQHDQRNAFGRSDIYILCRLKPLTFDLAPCQDEIEAAQWMSIDELFCHKETSAFTRQMTRLVINGLDRGFEDVDITANWTKSVFKTNIQLFHRPLDE